MDEEDDVLTIDAAAEYLGVSKMTLYRRMRDGDIAALPKQNPVHKRRERILFRREDVERLKGQA